MEGYFRTDSTPFDIHFYFDEHSVDSALKIRADMAKAFPGFTFYEPQHRKVGPHPLPMWEAHFSRPYNKASHDELGSAIVWVMQNRKGHSVLFHPNTRDMLRDHSTDAIWLGKKLELDLEVIRKFLKR